MEVFVKYIKLCPFCGSSKQVYIETDDGNFSIRCIDCNADGPIATTKYKAKLGWNVRTNDNWEMMIKIFCSEDNCAHFDCEGGDFENNTIICRFNSARRTVKYGNYLECPLTTLLCKRFDTPKERGE